MREVDGTTRIHTCFFGPDQRCWNALLAPSNAIPRSQPKVVSEIWTQVTDNIELMINIVSNIQPLHTICNRRNKT
jgi:hypothetical protein